MTTRAISEELRGAVGRVLDTAVIDQPGGWILACPYHRGADGLGRLADAVIEAVCEALDIEVDV